MKNAILIGVLAALAAAIPMGAQQAAAPKQRSVKTQEEAKELQAVLQATTPEARVTAADEFIAKHPKSDFASLALFAAAQGFQQKNDFDKMVIYGERALESDPDDATKLQVVLMLGKGIAQKTREFDLDREEKLGRVEKYAATALDMLKTMAKPNPQISDEQWEGFKGQMVSDAHEALGMTALTRKNFELAITEFKTAVESTKQPDPAAEVRLAAAYNKAGKYDQAIAVCDKLMAQTDLHPAIRQYAQAERARAFQAKGGPAPAAPAAAAPAAAPAAPAAPATPASPAPAAKP
jgi:tetratricopeptide (TPR) repeat protein